MKQYANTAVELQRTGSNRKKGILPQMALQLFFFQYNQTFFGCMVIFCKKSYFLHQLQPSISIQSFDG